MEELSNEIIKVYLQVFTSFSQSEIDLFGQLGQYVANGYEIDISQPPADTRPDNESFTGRLDYTTIFKPIIVKYIPDEFNDSELSEAFLMISSQFYTQVQRFNIDFFMYHVEVDPSRARPITQEDYLHWESVMKKFLLELMNNTFSQNF